MCACVCVGVCVCVLYFVCRVCVICVVCIYVIVCVWCGRNDPFWAGCVCCVYCVCYILCVVYIVCVIFCVLCLRHMCGVHIYDCVCVLCEEGLLLGSVCVLCTVCVLCVCCVCVVYESFVWRAGMCSYVCVAAE